MKNCRSHIDIHCRAAVVFALCFVLASAQHNSSRPILLDFSKLKLAASAPAGHLNWPGDLRASRPAHVLPRWPIHFFKGASATSRPSCWGQGWLLRRRHVAASNAFCHRSRTIELGCSMETMGPLERDAACAACNRRPFKCVAISSARRIRSESSCSLVRSLVRLFPLDAQSHPIYQNQNLSQSQQNSCALGGATVVARGARRQEKGTRWQ